MVLPDHADAADRTALDAVAVLCHGGTTKHLPPAPHHHQTPDRALCPLSAGVALPAPAVAVPPSITASAAEPWPRPASTGPPTTYTSARLARGPPVLS